MNYVSEIWKYVFWVGPNLTNFFILNINIRQNKTSFSSHKINIWHSSVTCRLIQNFALTCFTGEEDWRCKVCVSIVPRSGVTCPAEQLQDKTNECRKNGQPCGNTKQCWDIRCQEHQVWKQLPIHLVSQKLIANKSRVRKFWLN